jgi:hypothetical protein
MSTAVIELFEIFSKSYTKEESRAIIRDIEEIIDLSKSSHNTLIISYLYGVIL